MFFLSRFSVTPIFHFHLFDRRYFSTHSGVSLERDLKFPSKLVFIRSVGRFKIMLLEVFRGLGRLFREAREFEVTRVTVCEGYFYAREVWQIEFILSFDLLSYYLYLVQAIPSGLSPGLMSLINSNFSVSKTLTISARVSATNARLPSG